MKFSFRGVLSKGAHNSAELLGCDGAVTILVEQGEGLLELGDLSRGDEEEEKEGRNRVVENVELVYVIEEYAFSRP